MSIRFIALVTTLLALAPSTSWSQAGGGPVASWTIVHAGTILPVPGQPPLAEQSLVIEGDRIDRIVAGYATADSLGLGGGADITVIDLREYFVLPGLMDMHVHLTGGGAPAGMPDEADDVYRLTTGIVNAGLTLRAGYTTVRNPGSAGWSIFALRDGVDAGDLEGPRMFVAGHTIRSSASDGSGSCYSVESCRQAVRRQIAMGADVIKVYATCSGSQPCAHKDAPGVFLMDELVAAVETARTRQLKVAAHAHTTAGINMALEAGVDSIEHGSWLDARSYELLVETGAYLVPTLAVKDFVRESLAQRSPEVRARLEASIAEHPRRVFEAFQAGAKIASGSDAGVSRHGKNARELEWYVDIGLTEMEAIVTATVNAADLLGEADLGTLEAGKLADVIAVSESPLENISALTDVDFVMKGGTVYVGLHP